MFPAHFQIRGSDIPDLLLKVCRGELDLTIPANSNEEQLRNPWSETWNIEWTKQFFEFHNMLEKGMISSEHLDYS